MCLLITKIMSIIMRKLRERGGKQMKLIFQHTTAKVNFKDNWVMLRRETAKSNVHASIALSRFLEMAYENKLAEWCDEQDLPYREVAGVVRLLSQEIDVINRFWRNDELNAVIDWFEYMKGELQK